MEISPSQAIRIRARALRPEQWTKNAVVAAAFFFALGDRSQQVSLSEVWRVLAATGLFCAISSGIYLINDLRDRKEDRAHPVKRLRPIAAGQLPPRQAAAMALFLLAAGLTAAGLLAPLFGLVASGYVLMQLAYSFGIKRIALLDVFIIAAGFVLRAVAGAAVLAVRISPWLLLCTFLLALFLALCKRRQEKACGDSAPADTRSALQHYDRLLLDQLIAMTAAATLVTYAIYTFWPDTVDRFHTHGLGFSIPFVAFGLFRYLDLVYRHAQGERPERLLLHDTPLLTTIVLYAVAVLAAILQAR